MEDTFLLKLICELHFFSIPGGSEDVVDFWLHPGESVIATSFNYVIIKSFSYIISVYILGACSRYNLH